MEVLVTGTAGFIGNAVAKRLLERGDSVVGVDCLVPYYDVQLKEARLDRLRQHEGFREERWDLRDGDRVHRLFKDCEPTAVIHLAAQAGVRHSMDHPHDYVGHNVTATLNILEACRRQVPDHLLFASSASVYGANRVAPFAEHHHTAHPVSLYGATKRAAEAMAHGHSHLFQIPTTALRFFSVYGPWGRPDMALFLFTKAILAGEPIDVYNEGKMRRDWTYVDDIVTGTLELLARPPQPMGDDWDGTPAQSPSAPYRVRNIGNSSPQQLMDFIHALENRLGKEADKRLLPLQPGDVPEAHADTTRLASDTGWRPSTPIQAGIDRFIDWYLDHYGIEDPNPNR